MKRGILLFIMVLFFQVTQAQKPGMIYGATFNTFDTKGLITTDDNGITTFSMPDSLKESTWGFWVAKLPMTFTGDSVEVRYKIKLNDCTQRGWSAPIMPYLLYFKSEMTSFSKIDSATHYNSDWREVSIKSPIRDSCNQIMISMFLPYSGSFEIPMSDIKIYVDGTEYDKLTEPRYAYLKDNEFDGNSKINLSTLSQEDVSKLTLAGQLWSFLKYYHPVAGGLDYNWDYELFRMLPRVLKSSGKADTEQWLCDWVEKFGKFPVKEDSVAAMHFIDEMQIQNETLQKLLTTVICSEREFNKYGSVGLTGDFNGESAYNLTGVPDVGYRLLALFRYWGAVNYYFPYKYAIGTDWNKVLSEQIPIFVNADTDEKYKLALLGLFASINDSHASSSMTSLDSDSPLLGSNGAPIMIRYIENQFVITGFIKGESVPELKVGDVIKQVNGKPASQLAQEMYPYINASNEVVKYRNIAINLLRTNEKSTRLVCEREGKLFEVVVPCNGPSPVTNAKFLTQSKAADLYIKDSVLYIYPMSVDVEHLDSVLHSDAFNSIIFDLRCHYPHDLSILTNFIMEKRSPFVKAVFPSMTRPGVFDRSGNRPTGAPNENPFRGKVVLLVNEHSQSEIEFDAMEFQACPNAFVIGSQTAGADGNITEIVLPGNIKTAFTGMGIYYPDGSETQRVGIRVDKTVKPTIAGIRAGRDEVLEAAFSMLK